MTRRLHIAGKQVHSGRAILELIPDPQVDQVGGAIHLSRCAERSSADPESLAARLLHAGYAPGERVSLHGQSNDTSDAVFSDTPMSSNVRPVKTTAALPQVRKDAGIGHTAATTRSAGRHAC